ncbi:MAG: transposase [Puniceicoccales bacterium]|nr:transposase [Puniceicoccales bacterium]
MKVGSIGICTGEMPECQISKGEKDEEYERAMSVCKKEDIVCVDEGGIDRRLHRRNARSAKEKKVFGFVAGKKFQRRNIVAGIDGKIIAECIYNCTTDGKVFNAWVEQSLVAALKPGQVAVMNNGAFHKHRQTREAIEALAVP